MLIGILSDTHDKLERTARAVQLFDKAGVEALIHCGDICDQEILGLFAGTLTYYVMGNNDDDAELRQAWTIMDNLRYLHHGSVIELAGKRIGVTHGHLHRVVSELRRQTPEYLMSGHTHFASDEIINGIRCINPGALHRANEYSIATLDLISGSLQILPVPA